MFQEPDHTGYAPGVAVLWAERAVCGLAARAFAQLVSPAYGIVVAGPWRRFNLTEHVAVSVSLANRLILGVPRQEKPTIACATLLLAISRASDARGAVTVGAFAHLIACAAGGIHELVAGGRLHLAEGVTVLVLSANTVLVEKPVVTLGALGVAVSRAIHACGARAICADAFFDIATFVIVFIVPHLYDRFAQGLAVCVL